jgi:hypothetical protein
MNKFRKIFISSILFFAASSLFGQEFKFGVLLDPTITWLKLNVEDVTRDKARLGIDAGLSVDYFFAEKFALASGVSLFNMGGTLRYANGVENFRTKDGNVQIEPRGNVKYKLQYIKIPVALKFKTDEIGHFSYSANLGLDPMIRVSARADVNDLNSAKVNKEIKLFNFGWHFGITAHYALGQKTSVFGGLSYLNTFSDITKSSHGKITSNNISLRAGVIF